MSGNQFPHFSEFFEYLRCIRRAPLSFRERIDACYGELLRGLKANNKRPTTRLRADVMYVVKRFIQRTLHVQGHPSEAR